MRRFRLKPNVWDDRSRAAWLEEGTVYDGVVLQDESRPQPTVRLFRPRTEDWVEVPLDLVEEVRTEGGA